jgi:hypothetical protein
MPLQSVFGSNGHVVEETKTHGFVMASVVSRRPYGTKSVFKFSRHHGIGGL